MTTTDRLITYPAPSEAVGNSDFTVRIRQSQGEWQPLFIYNVKGIAMTCAMPPWSILTAADL
ncbi:MULTISPECIES: hypothetical protein [Paenibacillus]|uniref:hypothetical protein n=1 Tax=Paenibacillus TaxID=44249 RepID=UPI001FC9FFE1|nr:hypothetical protein [Paenibacillus rhizosphaerae]